MALKLGMQLGYWQAQPHPNFVELAQEAERLGYDSVWTAEAWGSDALTPLAWIGAHTSRIRLGTAIVPALRAHADRDRDARAHHRPPLGRPHDPRARRLRAAGRRGLVRPAVRASRSRGRASTSRSCARCCGARSRSRTPARTTRCPTTARAAWHLGKPLRSITHPLRADLPIFLGAEGPKNVALAAEIADGWLPLYYSPFRPEVYADSLQNAKPGFEIAVGITVNVTDDVAAGLAPVKAMLGFYIGGMGAKSKNFHKELMARMGFEAEANRIQELFFAGDRAGAIAAVPDQFADEISLVGPPERIRERLAAFDETPVTTLLVFGRDAAQLRQVAELVLNR